MLHNIKKYSRIGKHMSFGRQKGLNFSQWLGYQRKSNNCTTRVLEEQIWSHNGSSFYQYMNQNSQSTHYCQYTNKKILKQQMEEYQKRKEKWEIANQAAKRKKRPCTLPKPDPTWENYPSPFNHILLAHANTARGGGNQNIDEAKRKMYQHGQLKQYLMKKKQIKLLNFNHMVNQDIKHVIKYIIDNH